MVAVSRINANRNDVALTIANMNRRDVQREILNFHGRFHLDFTKEFLDNQTTEQLKHILLAAKLQLHPERN